MSSPTDRLDHTQRRLAKIETLQQTLFNMQRELASYRDALNRKLGLLQNNQQATVPPPTPPRRDSKPILTPMRRDSRPVPRLPTPPTPVPTPTPSGDDPAAKRSAPRRKGNPVPVVIGNDNGTMDPIQGWVLDRSSGGLRILVDQPITVGTILTVRPGKAHGSFPWIRIQVRSCQPERNSYALGVQFVAKPAWGEMQAFG